MTRIVVLDGYTLCPGAITWAELDELGEVTMYGRTLADMISGRIGGAPVVLTIKSPITREVMLACPWLRCVGVLATG